MGGVMTKRVRMDEAMLKSLDKIAGKKGMSVSEILREGVRIQERMIDREEHILLLIQAVDDVPGEDIDWSLNP